MTEAMYLLKCLDQKKRQEMQNAGLTGFGMAGPDPNSMAVDLSVGMNPYFGLDGMNDEVIKKMREYLNDFVQIKDMSVTKTMRQIGKQHNIRKTLFVKIMDLGLRDYEEAVSLFPDLKHYEKEHVMELLNQVKNNAV